jgi:hypothetical protein
MRDILMRSVAKGFVVPELVADNDKYVFCLKLAVCKFSVHENTRQDKKQ